MIITLPHTWRISIDKLSSSTEILLIRNYKLIKGPVHNLSCLQVVVFFYMTDIRNNT